MWTEVNTDAKKFITYSGEFPDKLYRYRTVTPSNLDRIINFEILEETIYLAGFHELNDPDEGRFFMEYRGSENELFQYCKKALKSSNIKLSKFQIKREARILTRRIMQAGNLLPENVINLREQILGHLIRVACFTTKPVNYSMWANYAKFVHPENGPLDHGGICIEYQGGEHWRSTTMHPVEYSDTIPKINLVKRDESELVKAAYMKSMEWRCEDEWRIAYVIQSTPPFPDNLTLNSKIRVENGVTGIIFGKNTPDWVVEKIRAIVSVAKPNVLHKKVIRNLWSFKRELVELQ